VNPFLQTIDPRPCFSGGLEKLVRLNREPALHGLGLWFDGIHPGQRPSVFPAAVPAPQAFDVSVSGRVSMHFPNLFELN